MYVFWICAMLRRCATDRVLLPYFCASNPASARPHQEPDETAVHLRGVWQFGGIVPNSGCRRGNPSRQSQATAGDSCRAADRPFAPNKCDAQGNIYIRLLSDNRHPSRSVLNKIGADGKVKATYAFSGLA